MPVYSFDLLSRDDRFDDQEGTELPNDVAAEVYAEQIVEELKRAEPQSFAGWHLVVREGERKVLSLPFDGKHEKALNLRDGR